MMFGEHDSSGLFMLSATAISLKVSSTKYN